jgi:hypothetical protein
MESIHSLRRAAARGAFLLAGALALAAGASLPGSVAQARGAANGGSVAGSTQANGAGAGASSASTNGVDRPPASAILEKCVAAANQLERYATFAGRMVALPGTTGMAMRIDVEERAPGRLYFHRVDGAGAPGVSAWRTAEPGVQIFKDLKQVSNLAAQLEYRAIVRFRWTGPKGAVVRREVLHTPACRQPAHAGQVGG